MQKTANITKEDAGFVLNPDAELAQGQTLPGPWWVPSGLQPPHHAEYKYSSQHLNPNTCLSHLGAGQDQQKCAGDKTNPEEIKDSQNYSGNTRNSTHANGGIQIRLGQPMVSMTNSPQQDQIYGLFPGYGTQPTGSVMLPMSLATDDGTVYVNPKQYHRILCRRKVRAKAALQLKARQAKDKPYVHESRHLHAMRRPRGAGGRFLTSKEIENLNYSAGNDVRDKSSQHHHDHQQFSNPSRSSSSEVLQGETGNLSSSPTSKGKPNPYGSEVTSVLYSRQLDWYHQQQQLPSSVVVEDDHGCCNFLKA